jgi:hypothetical protein
MVRSLWQERSFVLMALLTITIVLLLSERHICSVVGPLLFGLLVGAGGWKACIELVPLIREALSQQPLLLRLALLGALFDLVFTIVRVFWT